MADAPDDIPYQSLYRRFRPSTFEEVKGQDHVVLALRNAVRDGRVAHAYLFSGPRGTGKTSTARILAKALNCADPKDGEPCCECVSCVEITRGSSLDVHELDAASNNGVDAMRDLVSRAALGTPGRQKVYIVDEVHMLSVAASNALLKTLEEPPSHVVFVLATTDPQKVLPTIRSRTQHFEFRLLGPDTLGELLAHVRDEANLDVPDEALGLAVRRGRGSARDALSVLDQVAASEAIDDDLPDLDEIVEAFAARDAGRALVTVARLAEAGHSPQQLTVDLVDHLRQEFLSRVAPDLVTVSGAERSELSAQAERVGLAALVRAIEVLGRTQVVMRDSPDPRVNLEVALVRLVHPEADESPEAMLARIERLEAAAHHGAPEHPAPSRSPSTDHPVAPLPEEADGPVPKPPPSASSRTLGAHRRQSEPVPARPSLEPQPAAPAPSPAPAPAAGDAGQPPPPAPDRVEASPVPFPTRDALVQAWGDHIVGGLRPKAKALFQAGRFVGVDAEKDRAIYALPNEIHRSRCEEMRSEVETVLADHFHRPVGLTLVVDSGPSAPPVPDAVGAGDGGDGGAGRGSGPGGAVGRPTSGRRGSTRPRTPEPAPAGGTDTTDPPDDFEGDLSVFDEDQLGEVAEVDNSAEARVLQAFPGAEEVR